jgi:cell division protein FtsL
LVVAEQRSLPIESEIRPRPATGANPAVRKCTVLTLAVLAGFALVMLYTYQTTRIITLGYQAEKVQSGISDLQSENNQMELEIAELQTPERVAQIATTKLGMQEPQDFMVVSFSSGQVSSQESQSKTSAPSGSWSTRLLAAIPKFLGRAEASPL